MKVLLIDQFSDLGGAQQCFLDLLPAIVAAGWSVTAALPGLGPYADRLSEAGAGVHEFPMASYSNGSKSFAERVRYAMEAPGVARLIRRIAESVRPDVVYVNGPRVLPAAALAARGLAPLLFHCHNHLPQASAARAAARALRWSNARAVSCCLHAMEPLRASLDPRNVEVVYNGVPGPSEPFPGAASRPFTFGLVGRISPEKGHSHFYQAAAALERATPGLRYLVCGDVLFGDPAALAYRDSLPSDAPVERLGWRADAGDVIAGIDVLVVPSIREPATPRVILEAYARGVPVLAYATGGIPEILTDGEEGVLLPKPDPDALADAMRALAAGPGERLRELGQNGRRQWRERFHVDRYRRDMLAAIRRTVETPAHA